MESGPPRVAYSQLSNSSPTLRFSGIASNLIVTCVIHAPSSTAVCFNYVGFALIEIAFCSVQTMNHHGKQRPFMTVRVQQPAVIWDCGRESGSATASLRIRQFHRRKNKTPWLPNPLQISLFSGLSRSWHGHPIRRTSNPSSFQNCPRGKGALVESS